MKLKFGVAIVLGLVAIGITIFLSRSTFQRSMKSAYSDYSGGLDRVVTVYDYNGNVLTTYEGKIDVEKADVSGKVKFDLNGKRTIVYGGIVIVQEK